MPFSHSDGRLLAVRWFSPHTIVEVDPLSGRVKQLHAAPHSFAAGSELHGGTPPLRFDAGHYLTLVRLRTGSWTKNNKETRHCTHRTARCDLASSRAPVRFQRTLASTSRPHPDAPPGLPRSFCPSIVAHPIQLSPHASASCLRTRRQRALPLRGEAAIRRRARVRAVHAAVVRAWAAAHADPGRQEPRRGRWRLPTLLGRARLLQLLRDAAAVNGRAHARLRSSLTD